MQAAPTATPSRQRCSWRRPPWGPQAGAVCWQRPHSGSSSGPPHGSPLPTVKSTRNGVCGDRPAGLVVKILPFHRGCVGSIPGQGTKILHATWYGQKLLKKKEGKSIGEALGTEQLLNRLWLLLFSTALGQEKWHCSSWKMWHKKNAIHTDWALTLQFCRPLSGQLVLRVTPAPKPPSRGGRERGQRKGLSEVWAALKEKGRPVCGVLFFRGLQREVVGSESISQRQLTGWCLWRRAPGGGRSPGYAAVDWNTARRRGQQLRDRHGSCVQSPWDVTGRERGAGMDQQFLSKPTPSSDSQMSSSNTEVTGWTWR